MPRIIYSNKAAQLQNAAVKQVLYRRYVPKGKNIPTKSGKPRAKPGTRVDQEIKKEQRSIKRLLPLAPLRRVIVSKLEQYLGLSYAPHGLCVPRASVMVFAYLIEHELINRATAATMSANHAGRVTVSVKDEEFISRLQGIMPKGEDNVL